METHIVGGGVLCGGDNVVVADRVGVDEDPRNERIC